MLSLFGCILILCAISWHRMNIVRFLNHLVQITNIVLEQCNLPHIILRSSARALCIQTRDCHNVEGLTVCCKTCTTYIEYDCLSLRAIIVGWRVARHEISDLKAPVVAERGRLLQEKETLS